MTLASDIGSALAARLATVTALNGWPVPFRGVYHDKIPMGLELSPEQMPAVFVLEEAGTYAHKHQALEIARAWRLQLVDADEVTDDRMSTLIAEAIKSIYCNSATAQVQDQFRFHPRVIWVELDSDEGDLHMIDGNRIATLRFIVHYRARPYEL